MEHLFYINGKLVLPILRDRGIKKWVSLMLPEYVQSLRELEMDNLKVDQPVLDEQQYEELNRLIFEALAENKLLQFSYYSNEAIEIVTGRISFLDDVKKEIHIIDKDSNTTLLKIKKIIRIEE